jgi:hypothetical protein
MEGHLHAGLLSARLLDVGFLHVDDADAPTGADQG